MTVVNSTPSGFTEDLTKRTSPSFNEYVFCSIMFEFINPKWFVSDIFVIPYTKIGIFSQLVNRLMINFSFCPVFFRKLHSKTII